MNYCEYDAITGRILSVGEYPDSLGSTALAHFTNPTLTGIDPLFRGTTHYIIEGNVVAFPEKPNKYVTWDWETKQWKLDTEQAEVAVKQRRSVLLLASDWTQLPDVPLETKEAWKKYRQALRDITEHPGYPFEVSWPELP